MKIFEKGWRGISMERVMSVEDKIRKAEEIYYRRKGNDMPGVAEIKTNNKEKNNKKYFKTMIRQIVICLFLYIMYYFVVSNNYAFSETFIHKAKEILDKDINFFQIYSSFVNQEKTKEEIQSNNENIGGAEELIIEEANNEDVENKEVPLSQMEIDANYIKSTINFIKPVKGTISSMFGLRNPTTASVPKNHTGTDIAAVTGTKIVSATDGTVIYKSSNGDYGNHLKIQINDVIILYAHCNKLYVNEGDIIKQGQEIAEVGSTGNTTGPHLHFEIKYQDRYVDPQLILEL